MSRPDNANIAACGSQQAQEQTPMPPDTKAKHRPVCVFHTTSYNSDNQRSASKINNATFLLFSEAVQPQDIVLLQRSGCFL
jgi:hypothetical protein